MMIDNGALEEVPPSTVAVEVVSVLILRGSIDRSLMEEMGMMRKRGVSSRLGQGGNAFSILYTLGLLILRQLN